MFNSYDVQNGEWTMPVGRYRLLRPNELKKAGLGNNQAAICIQNNKIIALITLDTTQRGVNCDNCTNECAVGFIAWVKQGFRGNGIVGDLHAWFRDQIGVTGPLYVSKAETVQPQIAAIWKTHALRIPPGFQFTPTATQLDNEQRTYDFVKKISPLLGFDV